MTKIDHFPPNYPLGSDLNVAILVNVNWALPAELQGARSQVLVGRVPNDLAHLRAARVEDVIEAFLQQLRRLLNASGHDLKK